MQMLTDRKSEDDLGPTIDSVESMREYIYQNKTEVIYSYVGDHTIGQTKIDRVQMTGKTYKYVNIDREVTKTLAGLPIDWENTTSRNVVLKSSGEAILVDLTDDEKSASKFIQRHYIKYDFDVEEDARDFYGWREIITDLGGIYVAASKVLEGVGIYFMIQYFWYLANTKKRLAGQQLNMNAIEEMRATLKDALPDNQALSSEIEEALEAEVDEYGYTETREFKEKLEALMKKVKIPQREPKYPFFNIEAVTSVEKKMKHAEKEVLEEVKEMSTLDQVMEIKEAVSIIGILQLNQKLVAENTKKTGQIQVLEAKVDALAQKIIELSTK